MWVLYRTEDYFRKNSSSIYTHYLFALPHKGKFNLQKFYSQTCIKFWSVFLKILRNSFIFYRMKTKMVTTTPFNTRALVKQSSSQLILQLLLHHYRPPVAYLTTHRQAETRPCQCNRWWLTTSNLRPLTRNKTTIKIHKWSCINQIINIYIQFRITEKHTL